MSHSLAPYLFKLKTTTKSKKKGFVNPEGGIPLNQADSIAEHSYVVTALALEIACAIQKKFPEASVNPYEVMMMAFFHDMGEGLSGDTGAQSKALYPTEHCHLYTLEEDGLKQIIENRFSENQAIKLFQDYRSYTGVLSLITHVADKIEGFHKGVMGVPQASDEYVYNILRILSESVALFQSKAKGQGKDIEEISKYLINEFLIPSTSDTMKLYISSFKKFDIDTDALISGKTLEVLSAIDAFTKTCESKNFRHW